MAFLSNSRENETAFSSTGPVATAAGTSAQDLYNFSLPAGALKRAGQGLRITAYGHTAANGNTKTVALTFGGVALTATASAAANNKDWFLSALVIRGAAGFQEALGQGNFNQTALNPVVTDMTLDETAAQAIKLTATDGTSSAGDVTVSGFYIEGLSD